MSSEQQAGIVAECERLLVATLLASPTAWQVAGHLQPGEFNDPVLREIYAAGLACIEADEEPGPVEIGQRLANGGTLDKVGGYPGLLRLADAGVERDAGGYVWRVAHGAMMREAAAAYVELGKLLETANLEDAPKMRERMVEILLGEAAKPTKPKGMRSLYEVQRQVVGLMQHRRANPHEAIGIGTGLRALDERWVALEAGQMVVVGARPGMGKTALAINIAMHATASGPGWVCYFSAEVPDVKITLRTLAIGSGVSGRVIRTGRATDNEVYQVVSGMKVMDPWSQRFLLDDTPRPSPTTIRRALRGVARQGQIRLVVVDHMHLMEPPRQRNNDEREQSEISAGLLCAAKEFGVPLIALSQLNRSVDDRQDKRPVMRDLRGSGAIEQDADIVAFLYRDEQSKGLCEIISRKVREDAPGTDLVRFDTATQRFTDVLVPPPTDHARTAGVAPPWQEPPEREPGWWHGGGQP